MSYNDFVNEVKNILADKYGYSADKSAKVLKDADSVKVLRTNYNAYNDKKYAGSNPLATASCIDMMN